jgi:16S rRNA processing protein RimM
MADDGGMVCVASVATAHGVRGALKLRCYTEEPESVAAYGPVFDAQGRELFHLTVIGSTKGGVIARAEGIGDRDAAEALRGLDLYVPRDRLPATDEDEFYVSDLVGMEAVGPDGSAQGRIVAVHNFGAGDLIEVQPAEGESQLVPFTREAVPDVDLAARRAVVVLPRAE